MDNENILKTLTEICETISLKGVYSNYAWCSEKLSEILSISDPAEINDIMLHISRLSFLKSPRSVYQWCTPKFASLFCFQENTAIKGKSDNDLEWGGDASSVFQAADEQVVSHNHISIAECRALLPDTTERFLKAKLYPIYNLSGQIVGILGVVREVLSADMQASRQVVSPIATS
ncbi:MAG: sensor hybrid histidine kinase [Gammaproteobacteria bacterium]|jgi:PAS domain-containing protein|nr:sensor hybrid histidine kinase [Gammaproteobacteria bacterium]